MLGFLLFVFFKLNEYPYTKPQRGVARLVMFCWEKFVKLLSCMTLLLQVGY